MGITVLESLQTLREAAALDHLDAAFGDWMARWGGEPVALAAALICAETARGHVYLDLATAGEMLAEHQLEAPANWAKTLRESRAVTSDDTPAPLVLETERLYLHRYWHYETRIAKQLRALATPVPDLDIETLQAALREESARPAPAGNKLDRQRLAAVLGASRRLAIISGGPGTGKTTTVKRLVKLARRLEPDLTVALAAPTGKAAARLAEAADALGVKPQTVHRLLGYHPATQHLRHDAEHPIAADLIVVDEASMVDIGLMARLLEALPATGRLVLVGDRNQLASVEVGVVFGDICQAAQGFPAPEAETLERCLGAAVPKADQAVSPLSTGIALLRHNYRYGEGGIGALADAVLSGSEDNAFEVVQRDQASDHPSLAWQSCPDKRALDAMLRQAVARWFKPVLAASNPAAALAALQRFRLLAAERHGVFGVEGLNTRIEQLLGLNAAERWYAGRPVLITENDREIEVFNGDFGILWPDEHGHMRLWLETPGDAPPRTLSPACLPAHETAWALTVHKAQGSEFQGVALVLPPRDSRVATRELLYTGLTRARETVAVWATEAALRAAIRRRIRRASGLAERLAP